MKIFKVIDSFNPKDRWYLRGPKKCERGKVSSQQDDAESWGMEVEGWHFTGGEKYEMDAPLVIPIQQGTVALDFTLGSMDMPIVKHRVTERLKALCGDDVQWIPAVVPGTDEAFEIANTLTLVNALDLDRSEVCWWTEKDNWPEKVGTICAVGRIVLKKELLGGVTMFRLTGWEPPLLVSEVIKNALEDLQVTGIKFQEIAVS